MTGVSGRGVLFDFVRAFGTGRTLVGYDQLMQVIEDQKILAGDEYEQAKLIFAKIRHLVEAAGGKMSDVVKVTIFVTDITQREKVWRARREVFAGDFPTSTLVQVAALAEPSLRVEIEAIAHIGAGVL